MEISAESRTYHRFNNHKIKEIRSQLYEEQYAVSKSERRKRGCVPQTTKTQKSRFKSKKSKKVKRRVKKNHDS